MTFKLVLFVAVASVALVSNFAIAEESVRWGYTGAGSATYWGDLDESYRACKDGRAQSPINITEFAQDDLPPLNIAYAATPLEVVNNGHTVQVNYQSGSYLNVNNKVYNLLQFHFHTPSEHYIDGSPYPMEAHFVHKADDGTLGVVGVMIKIGAHNPVVEGIWQNVPMKPGKKSVESVSLNGAALMPESKSYYKYEGSLTTPPCSEGVQWHVLKTPIEMSAEQVLAFQTLFPVNARPVQKLHGRQVKGD